MKHLLTSALLMFVILFSLPVQAQTCTSAENELISTFVANFAPQAQAISEAYGSDTITDEMHEPVMWLSVNLLTVSAAIRNEADCDTVNAVLDDFDRFASLSLTTSVIATQPDTYDVLAELMNAGAMDTFVDEWHIAHQTMFAYFGA